MMYLLNLVNGRTRQAVTVPMWDSTWSDSEKAVLQTSTPAARSAMFLVGLLGISHAEAAERSGRHHDVILVASVEVRGKVVYTEVANDGRGEGRREG